MRRRRPRSTLFPTRRSSDLAAAAANLSDDFPALKQFSSSIEHNISSFLGMQGPKMEYSNEKWDGEEVGKSEGKDRKSTRLNSSHGYISYAVFCLKKKTQ